MFCYYFCSNRLGELKSVAYFFPKAQNKGIQFESVSLQCSFPSKYLAMTSNAAQQLLVFTLLVAANILCYNLHNLVDVACLRELNQDFRPLAVSLHSLVPFLVPTSVHFLPTSKGTNDFINYLVWPWNADW
jgi:hypothetical protein